MKSKHLDKLSQLDRIEYKLEDKELNSNFNNWSPYGLMYFGFIYTFVVILYSYLLVMIDPIESYNLVLALTNTVSPILKLIMIVVVFSEILRWYSYIKDKKKLNNKFFNFKVEVNKR